MALPKHQRERKLKKPPKTELEPLTQDWADSLYTLLLAAGMAAELEQPMIKTLCLAEVRRILRRGEPEPEEKAPKVIWPA